MKNKITNEEAREALRDVELVAARARNQAMAEFVAFPLMLWGLIWALCHITGYFYIHAGFRVFGLHPDRVASFVIWGALCITFGFIFFKLRYAPPTRSKGPWFVRYRAALLPVVWFLFHFASGPLLAFEHGRQMNAYYSIYWMLLYIVYGFWLLNGLLLTIGVLVTVWTLIGYFFLGDHYSLWMGIMTGITLFSGGLYAKLRYAGSKEGANRG
jgi:hypothetical protein